MDVILHVWIGNGGGIEDSPGVANDDLELGVRHFHLKLDGSIGSLVVAVLDDVGDRLVDGEDDFVFVTGRLKELIIKGGENIAPREIDDALYSHPSIIEAGAVGIDDEHYGQEVIACVVVKENAVVTEQELRDFCCNKLGKVKTPKNIFFFDDLPKGPSGKVQRLKLVDQLKARNALG